MIGYPVLLAELERRDLDADGLAVLADVDAGLVTAILDAQLAPSLPLRARIRRALGFRRRDLFRLDDDLEAVRADLEAQGRSWVVTDPATLRAIDRQAS